MKDEYKKALKCMVFAQSFVKEVDKFLNHTYKNGSTDTSLINLIEGMQNAIDKVIDEDVIVTD